MSPHQLARRARQFDERLLNLGSQLFDHRAAIDDLFDRLRAVPLDGSARLSGPEAVIIATALGFVVGLMEAGDVRTMLRDQAERN